MSNPSSSAGNAEWMTSASQVERARNAARARGDDEALFAQGHRFARLVRASYSRICDSLAPYDINLLFNQTADPSDPRSAFRKDYGALLGPGMNLIMPTAGAYMCSPGQNRVFLPERTDRTLAEYLQRVGFLGEVVFHDGEAAMLVELRRSGRRVYSIDDLGPGVDELTANSLAHMEFLNSKETVRQLSAYAAEETHKDVFAVTADDYHAAAKPGRRVYLKTCNTENAGEGVFPVDTLEQFLAELEGIRARTEQYGLNRTLVIQPEILGDNKSFQIFLRPDEPERVPVVALTDQLVDPDGKKYAGSLNHVVTTERTAVVAEAILDLVDRIGEHCPGAFGFVMCDYFEQDEGRIVTFDPGLRPSSNTGAAMVKLWVEEAAGQSAGVTNSPWFDFGEPGITYAEIVRRLGKYADPDYIVSERLGVLPRGHNPIQGKTRFIIVTPEPEDYPEFRAEL
ncbi:MAG: hypothetical protein JRI23_21265, partial [Deltaproteobacteria bacterium]|nr:hypothetical protein [Deltaproteobacteria bacterium]MBW2534473.1 hypothetical protein [Deltaproteobacteria bacterium]